MVVGQGFKRCVVVVAASTAMVPLLPDTVALASPAARLVLMLRITAPRELAPFTKLALLAETQSIWNDHVRLHWVDRDDGGGRGPFLRVVVTPHVGPDEDDDSPWVVGELVRHDGQSAVAFASLTGARRIVDDTGFRRLDLPAMYDRRLGIVLGRAVAHEIGHYLLQTNTHAGDGLMRARIQTEEFVDLRRAAFRLDRAAAAHLAAIASSGAFPAERSAFSYEPR
jgi:hypothetical protein